MADALGIPLIGDADGQPIAALVVVKCFDDDADAGVSYTVLSSGDLSTIEALGMARYATLRLEHGVTSRMDED